jgi:tRNA A-37 threonylcarbamoyl transferase component Bud32
MSKITLSCPFTARLKHPEEKNIVQCEQLLRSVPSKRLVCKGVWQQRVVVVKLYLDIKSGSRHWQREKDGVKSLSRASISTPELLFSGYLEDETPILIFDFLPAAQTAMETWGNLTSVAQKSEFLKQLVEVVGELHDAGLVQKDLHLENFLISESKIYAIDGDAIDRNANGTPLDLFVSSENLALFFAQLSPQDDYLIEPVALHYANYRQLPALELLARLELNLPDVRRKRRLKYVKKSYRTCSEFVRTQSNGKLTLSRRDLHGENLSRLLEDPDAFMAHGRLLKDGNSSTVVRVQGNDYDWVIKRYNISTLSRAVRRYFRPTRAWVSWGNAHRLKISGIATPKAVALIEKRIGPLRSTGYYICDFVEGLRADAFFQADRVSRDDRERGAREFVRLFEMLYKLNIHHGDYKSSNFLLKDCALWVLDLDAMRECCSQGRFENLFQVDRKRFLRNWQLQPELQQWFDEHLPGKGSPRDLLNK